MLEGPGLPVATVGAEPRMDDGRDFLGGDEAAHTEQALTRYSAFLVSELLQLPTLHPLAVAHRGTLDRLRQLLPPPQPAE